MLESNTDRSYFMIGAVIVAAVLIAGALFIFRDVLFSGEMVDHDNNPATANVSKGYIPRLVDNIFAQSDKMITNIDSDLGHGK